MLKHEVKHSYVDLDQYSGMHIGKKIKDEMKRQKVTAKAMAAVCEVTPGAVSNWFSSGRISKPNLAKAAQKLNLDLAELISGEARQPVIDIPSADPMAESRSYIVNDLSKMLARFNNPDHLRHAYGLCISAIDEFTETLARPTPPANPASDRGAASRAPVKPALAPKIRTPSHR